MPGASEVQEDNIPGADGHMSFPLLVLFVFGIFCNQGLKEMLSVIN